jgi:hypothetical protein
MFSPRRLLPKVDIPRARIAIPALCAGQGRRTWEDGRVSGGA